MAKFLILFLTLFSVSGCALPVGSENDMANRNLENQTPIHPGAGIPAVVPIIPASGMWTGNNQLGALVQYAPNTQNRQTILKLPEWGPPEEWTISLFLRDQQQQFSALGIQAEIDFGVGGGTQQVIVDWANGVEITKTMNAVNIIASYTTNDFVGATEGPGLQLGVQLARGTRGGTQTPKVTIASELDLAATTTSAPLAIPPFVSEVFLVPISAPGGVYIDTVLLQGVSAPTGGFSTGQVRGSDIRLGINLPVVEATRFLTVTNGSGGAISVAVVGLLYG